MQISSARKGGVKVKKPWFLLSTHSWFSGGDRVGHSLLCSVLTWKSTTENCWTLPVLHQDALSGPHGWRPASLEYCLFPAQMKAPRLWWSGLCEVHVHCTTKEKSLSCSLAARSTRTLSQAVRGRMQVRRHLFFLATC